MYRPDYVIGNGWLKQVGQIEAAREVIQMLPLSVDWQMKLKDLVVVTAVENGLKTDGVKVTGLTVKKIIDDDPGREEMADEVIKRLSLNNDKWAVQAVMNYINGRKYVEQLIHLGGGEMDSSLMKDVMRTGSLLTEKLLPADNLGEYRKTEVVERWARDWWKQPVAIEVTYQMDDLWSWWRSDAAKQLYRPMAVAILTYEWLRIRPLTMANGRVAGLMAWLLLSGSGYYLNGWYSVEEIMDWSIMSQGDLSLWIEDFLTNLAKASGMIKETVKRLSGGEVKVRERVIGFSRDLTSRQKVLVELLKLRRRITMGMAKEALPGISEDTIWRDLKMLLKKRVVKKKGSTRGTVYMLKSD